MELRRFVQYALEKLRQFVQYASDQRDGRQNGQQNCKTQIRQAWEPWAWAPGRMGRQRMPPKIREPWTWAPGTTPGWHRTPPKIQDPVEQAPQGQCVFHQTEFRNSSIKSFHSFIHQRQGHGGTIAEMEEPDVLDHHSFNRVLALTTFTQFSAKFPGTQTSIGNNPKATSTAKFISKLQEVVEGKESRAVMQKLITQKGTGRQSYFLISSACQNAWERYSAHSLHREKHPSRGSESGWSANSSIHEKTIRIMKEHKSDPQTMPRNIRLVSGFLTTSSNIHLALFFNHWVYLLEGGCYGHLSFTVILHLCLCYHVSFMLSCSCLYQNIITRLLAHSLFDESC